MSASVRLTELNPVTVRVQRRGTDAERVVHGLRFNELDAAGPEHFELLAQVVRLVADSWEVLREANQARRSADGHR